MTRMLYTFIHPPVQDLPDRMGKTRTLLTLFLTAACLAAWVFLQEFAAGEEHHGSASHSELTAPSGTVAQPSQHEHQHPKPTAKSSAYSIFMHHAAGVGMIMIGSLMILDRLTEQRHRMVTMAVGLTWIGLGIFLIIRSDPEGWPLGTPGFLESFTMPTAGEWIQHKVLAMIPVFMGFYAMQGGASRERATGTLWHYVAAALACFGGVALLAHMHLDHPGEMDIVNRQHRFFAVSALFISASLILETRPRITWAVKPYLFPLGLLLLGIQLYLYVEGPLP